MKFGQKGKLHTVNGDALAFVVGHIELGADPDNPDNDLEVVVFAGSGVRGSDSGLTGPVEYRYTHVDSQAGGFTAC